MLSSIAATGSKEIDTNPSTTTNIELTQEVTQQLPPKPAQNVNTRGGSMADVEIIEVSAEGNRGTGDSVDDSIEHRNVTTDGSNDDNDRNVALSVAVEGEIIVTPGDTTEGNDGNKSSNL